MKKLIAILALVPCLLMATNTENTEQTRLDKSTVTFFSDSFQVGAGLDTDYFRINLRDVDHTTAVVPLRITLNKAGKCAIKLDVYGSRDLVAGNSPGGVTNRAWSLISSIDTTGLVKGSTEWLDTFINLQGNVSRYILLRFMGRSSVNAARYIKWDLEVPKARNSE